MAKQRHNEFTNQQYNSAFRLGYGWSETIYHSNMEFRVHWDRYADFDDDDDMETGSTYVLQLRAIHRLTGETAWFKVRIPLRDLQRVKDKFTRAFMKALLNRGTSNREECREAYGECVIEIFRRYFRFDKPRIRMEDRFSSRRMERQVDLGNYHLPIC